MHDCLEMANRIPAAVKRIWIYPALVLIAVYAAGCGGSSSTVEESTSASISAKVIGHGSGELNCKSYPFENSGQEDWRRNSYSFGPFGVSRNFAVGTREPDGLLHSKTPMLVEGHRTVVVSIPKSERDRVGIEILSLNRGISTLVLKPCPDKKRTMWAAGFLLRDRRPVVLDVLIGARRGTVQVGPPESQG